MKSMYQLTARWFTKKHRQLPAGKITGMVCLFLIFTNALIAQTKIGDNPGTPRDASAMLEVSSTAAPFRGFLMPRITTAQRDAITNPAKALMIFNITTNQVEVNTGTPAAPIWSVPASPTPLAWLLTGNTGINPATQFLGTTDNQPLAFRANNAERMRIVTTGGGQVVINQAAAYGSYNSLAASPLANLAIVNNDNATTIPATRPALTLANTSGVNNSAVRMDFSLGETTAGNPINVGSISVVKQNGIFQNWADGMMLFGVSGVNNSTADNPARTVMALTAGLRVGIGTTAPAQTLHVAGTARISGSAGTATALMGRNAAGDIGNLTLGSGLSITGGTLNTTAASGWSLTGNAGTNQATQFLGTTDLQPLIFRTNNLERMRISNNGFLGIGTTTPPSEKLHVAGGSAMVSNNAGTANPAILAVAENSNGGTMDDITIRTYGTATSAGFEQYTARGTAATPQPVVNGQNMGNLTFYGNTSAGVQGARSFITTLYAGDGTNNRTTMLLGTSDVERIRITDAGLVGIGTNAPAQMLDVAGTARISGSAGTATAVMGRNAAGDIGNLTLGSGLSITGGTLNTTAASGWSLTGNAGTSVATNFIGTTDNQDIAIRANNAERMRIVSGGGGQVVINQASGFGSYNSLGVGQIPNLAIVNNDNTTTVAGTRPALTLANISGVNNSAVRMDFSLGETTTGNYVNIGTISVVKQNGSFQNWADGMMLFGVSGVNNSTSDASTRTVMALTAGLRVGIGTTAPTAKLSVNGDANNTTGVWAVFSDDRIKTVDEHFTDGLATVLKIRPVKFHYNNDAPFKSDDQQIGIVAQEMESIAPYMISKVKAGAYNDLRKYNAQALPYMLVNAIQELKKELDGITQTNASLQQELSNLKAENAQLKADKNTMTELLARLAKLESTLGVASK